MNGSIELLQRDSARRRLLTRRNGLGSLGVLRPGGIIELYSAAVDDSAHNAVRSKNSESIPLGGDGRIQNMSHRAYAASIARGTLVARMVQRCVLDRPDFSGDRADFLGPAR